MPDVLENVPVVGVKRTFPRSFGRYVLEKSLSRGGMGEVFLTVAKGVNQRCVIKTIRGDLTGDEEFVGRFADEAKIMMRISHESIIRVFDAGKVGADYYIAMEYVHGRDLGDVLDRAYERGEPMPTQLGLYVASHLLDGLDFAHRLTDEHGRHMGVVHRDISPQNVLIGFDGSVKLIDFGLARTDLLPARTQGALAVGKYGYMSPEQARHEKIDGRADIYSTGVMLFEVFTGDRLVDEQDQATLWSRVLNPKHRRPTAVLPSIGKDIDDLVMTAVAVRTEDRFRDASEMRAAVQKLQTDKSNREDFVRYLRFLYPKVDFSPPPVPDFGNQFDDSEKSVIIATSREGAMSVFGRGELPIEWTTQIDAAELQAAFAKYRGDRAEPSVVVEGRRSKTGYEREVVTDGGVTDQQSAEPIVEATWVKARGDEGQRRPKRESTGGGRRSAPAPKMSENASTQVAEVDRDDLPGFGDTTGPSRARARPPTPASEVIDTRFPRSSRTEEEEARPPRAGVDLATEHAAPILGTSRVTQHFRDDEMTVMMNAPPRAMITRGNTPASAFADEETREGDLPTRLSPAAPSIIDPAVTPPVPIAATAATVRGRAIQERNSARDRARDEKTNLRDRTDRTDRADRADRADRPDRTDRNDRERGERPAAERGAAERSSERGPAERGSERSTAERGAATKNPPRPGPQRAAVALRATVPTDTPGQGPPKRGEDTLPPAGAPEMTEPEARRPVIGILPGIILLGLAVVIVLLVLLLLRF